MGVWVVEEVLSVVREQRLGDGRYCGRGVL